MNSRNSPQGCDARITLDNVTAWPNPEMAGGLFNYRDYLEAPRSQRTMHPARMALPVLAVQTGGLVLDARADVNPGQEWLQADIERCAADARSYYSLTFSPPRTDQLNEYHEIRVLVARPDVTARAPVVYYNEPVYFDSPRPGIEKVTVAGLEAIVHSAPDLGRRLPNLELMERL